MLSKFYCSAGSAVSRLVSLFALIALASAAIAQTNYTASTFPIGMTPITGGTVEFASNTALGGTTGDDSTRVITLPFTFNFYGTPYTQVTVSTNGLMTMGASPTSANGWTNHAIPSTSTPHAYIAPFWDDHRVYTTTSGPSGLPTGSPRTIASHLTEGTAPNRRFIFEYLYLTGRNVAIELSAQIMLYENGGIEIRYLPNQDWGTSRTMTIGIENQTGTIGVDLGGNAPSTNTPPTTNFRLEWLAPGTQPLGYNTGFEANDGTADGWSVTNPGASTNWEWTTLTGASGPGTGANGSQRAWKTGGNSNYANDMHTLLDSPTVSLFGATGPILSFFMNMDSEGSNWDGGAIHISRNGGPFTPIGHTDPAWLAGGPNRSDIFSLGSYFQTGSSSGWCGLIPSSSGYQEVKLDLFALTTAGLSGMSQFDTVRVRFIMTSDDWFTAEAGWTIDDFRLADPPQDDLGVQAITSPTTGAGSRSALPVTVTIKNFGGTPQNNFSVSYQLTGPAGTGPVVTETFSAGPLAPDATANFTFAATVDASVVGPYSITAYTGLGSDGNATNDSASAGFNTLGTVTAPYFQDFEANNGSGDGWLTGGSTASQWEWGAIGGTYGPQSGANGSVNAWATDIGNLYANSAEAFLETPFLNLAGTNLPRISFYHSVNSESGWDGGTLQISRNGGSFVTVSQNDPGWLQGGPTASSMGGGHSHANWNGVFPSPANTYQETVLDLSTVTTSGLTGIGPADQLIVRFWFRSDSSFNTNNGWVVDDFRFYDVPAKDVSIFSVDAPVTEVGGNRSALTVSVTVRNNGSQAQSNFPITYQITAGPNGPGAVVTENFAGPINPGASASFSFATTVNLSTAGAYTIAASTQLMDDANPGNDSINALVSSIARVSTLPWTTGFESGAPTNSQIRTAPGPYPSASAAGTTSSTVTSSNPSQVSVAGSFGSTHSPRTGNSALGIDFSGITATGAIDFNFDLSAYTKSAESVVFTFWYLNSLDSSDSSDGVFLSMNGGTSFQVCLQRFVNSTEPANTWIRSEIDLTSVLGPTVHDYTSTMVIRLQCRGSSSFPNDGMVFDDLSLVRYPPRLNVSLVGPTAAGGALAPANDVLLGVFDLSAVLSSVTVNSVTLARSGTASAADFPAVRLWLDADNSSTLTGTDVLLHAPATFVGGQLTFSGSPLAVLTAGQTARVLMTADIASSAAGKNAGLTVAGAASFSSLPNEVSGAFPLSTGQISFTSPKSVPYSIDFEGHDGNADGWAVGGNTASLWQWGAPVAYPGNNGGGPGSAQSGSNCWGTNLSGDYVASAQADLDSPFISLAGTIDPELRFWIHVDSESGYDGLLLQISRNGGSWVGLSSTDAGFIQNAPSTSNMSGIHSGNSAWTGSQPSTGGWQRVRVRLFNVNTGTLAGISSSDILRFRFRFLSDGSEQDYPGAYIDTVSVVEANRAPVIAARVAGVDMVHNGTFSVPFNSSVASRQILLTVTDPEGTPVTLGATVSNTTTHNGIVAAEWGSTVASTNTSLTPASGNFNIGSGSHLVTLTSTDGEDATTLAFTINVDPAPPASLAVGTASGKLGSTVVVPVNLNWNGTQKLGGVSATVNFPTTDLTFVSGALGSGQAAGLSASITALAGVVTIDVTSPGGTNIVSQGVLANLTFTVNGSATLGAASLTAGSFSTSNAGIVSPMHSATIGNANTSNGSVTITSTPPAVSITRGGFPVPSGSSFTVPYRATLASVGLAISATDMSDESLTITTQMPANAATAALVSAQFNGSSSVGNVNLSPSTGAFNTPGASYLFSVTASDGFTSTVATFTIQVGPNTDPMISVTMAGSPISAGSTSMVDIGATMASLGMVITVSDSDGDNVTLTGTVSNVTTQGILASQFSQSSQTVPYTRSPSSGTFSVPSVSHLVSLSATDGNGSPVVFNFTLAVRSNDPPAISVTSSFGTIANNGSITVPFKTSISDLGLVITLTDPDADDLTVTGTVSGITTQGILSSEFSSSGAKAPFALRPASGRFNIGGLTHNVSLTANDPYQSASFNFSVVVGPNVLPSIRVTSNGDLIGEAATVQVPFNTSVASLGLSIAVDDTERDNTSLVTTISNAAPQQGISLSEWQRIASAVPYTRSPLAGRFNVEGASHLVTITADDGFGGVSTRTFTVVVGLNSDPSLTVLSNGEPLAPSTGLFVGTTVASLGLSIATADTDVSTTVDLTASLTNLTTQGIELAEFQGSSANGSLTRSPTSGTFSVDGATHVLTLTASDGHGGTTVRSFTFVVSSQVRVGTTSLPNTVIGQSLNVTLTAVQGTAPYSWSSDNLPSWLSLSASTGVLSGRPPRTLQPGTVSFTVSVSDSSTGLSNSDSRQLSLTLLAPVPLNRDPIPAGSLPQPSNPVSIATPTTEPIRNQVFPVDLPFPVTFFGTVYTRIYISSNGFISFDDPGENSFPANTALTNPVGPMNAIFVFWDSLEMPVGTSSITTGVAGPIQTSVDGPVVNTNHQAFVIGFNGMQVVGKPGTSLTGSVSITATGEIGFDYPQTGQNWDGATATVGVRGPTTNEVVDAYDSGSQQTSPPLTALVVSQPEVVELVTQAIPAATGLVAYNFAMAATGGSQPYTWNITEGPEWLSIDTATGVLSGTPPITEGGLTTQVTVSVGEAEGTNDERAYTLVIVEGTPPAPAPRSGGGSCSVSTGGSGGLLLAMLAIAMLAFAMRRRRVA